MSVAEKALALLEHLRPEDVRSLPPVRRRQLADACKRCLSLADPPEDSLPKAGILAEIRNGAPRHE
jgi:hypothetical protein